uniref:NADH dehydrogenase subunit 9 n=1 Tax=Diplonema japonicum TaxID=2508216 RepID=A0A6G5ZTP4_9EUGL|nr:NADH dehydrogenase subunit 9 [Diplonema japonicum]
MLATPLHTTWGLAVHWCLRTTSVGSYTTTWALHTTSLLHIICSTVSMRATTLVDTWCMHSVLGGHTATWCTWSYTWCATMLVHTAVDGIIDLHDTLAADWCPGNMYDSYYVLSCAAHSLYGGSVLWLDWLCSPGVLSKAGSSVFFFFFFSTAGGVHSLHDSIGHSISATW